MTKIITDGSLAWGSVGDGRGATDIRHQWRYWPEIDGLRTIAVLSVLIFHFMRSALPGGFVGVDIFFAISGFLIGSILLEDIAANKFSLANFYQRRIARIMPAMMVVIVLTLIVGWVVYSGNDFSELGANATYAAASVINMRLILKGSYFAVSPDAQPLIHYWSLAVEEQFYIFFPLFLYAIIRFTRRPLTIIAMCAIISFIACILMTRWWPTFAFYSLPTRAWELLAGSALALYRARGGRIGRYSSASAWVGTALIFGSVLAISESDSFPGWIAAIPIVGTIMVLASLGENRSPPLRLLAQPWMVSIGKRSYSLYLWHWPVFAFVDYHFLMWTDSGRALLKIVATLTGALLSYELIEGPLRKLLTQRERRTFVFLGAGAAIAAVAVAGLYVRDNAFYEVYPKYFATGGKVVRGGDKGTLLLMGDSEASMYGTVVGSIARDHNLTLYALSASGKNELPNAAGTYWPQVSQIIRSKKPDLVIMVMLWSEKLNERGPLRVALEEALKTARHVILVAQPPLLPNDATRKDLRNGRRGPFVEPADLSHQRLKATKILDSFASDRVTVLNVDSIFLDPHGNVRVMAPDGRMAYIDVRHLTDSGTALVRPLLEQAVVRGIVPH